MNSLLMSRVKDMDDRMKELRELSRTKQEEVAAIEKEILILDGAKAAYQDTLNLYEAQQEESAISEAKDLGEGMAYQEIAASDVEVIEE